MRALRAEETGEVAEVNSAGAQGLVVSGSGAHFLVAHG
jgi:hypothetical protein